MGNKQQTNRQKPESQKEKMRQTPDNGGDASAKYSVLGSVVLLKAQQVGIISRHLLPTRNWRVFV